MFNFANNSFIAKLIKHDVVEVKIIENQNASTKQDTCTCKHINEDTFYNIFTLDKLLCLFRRTKLYIHST